MIGSTEQCRAEADAVGANRIEESLRAMKPDISTAESWDLELSKVRHLQQSAQTTVRQGDCLDAAEKNVREAGELLGILLAECTPYAEIKSQLDRIGQRMGAVEPAMYDDVRDSTIARIMAPFRQPYWQLHARWAEAYGMLLEGPKDGLSWRVEELVSDSETLLADVDKAMADRSNYVSSGSETPPGKKESAFGLTPPAEARYVDGQACLDLLPRLKVVDQLPLEGWLFKDDRDHVGVARGYFKPDHPVGDFTKIRIGSFWDHQGDTVLEEGWYRLRYKCPKLPEGKRVFLHFGAVDETAWLYVDGELIAWYDTAHPGKTWNRPFLLEVTGDLKGAAEHLLAIRVGNTLGAGGIHKPVRLMVE
jgi:hypothetical protein